MFVKIHCRIQSIALPSVRPYDLVPFLTDTVSQMHDLCILVIYIIRLLCDEVICAWRCSPYRRCTYYMPYPVGEDEWYVCVE